MYDLLWYHLIQLIETLQNTWCQIQSGENQSSTMSKAFILLRSKAFVSRPGLILIAIIATGNSYRIEKQFSEMILNLYDLYSALQTVGSYRGDMIWGLILHAMQLSNKWKLANHTCRRLPTLRAFLASNFPELANPGDPNCQLYNLFMPSALLQKNLIIWSAPTQQKAICIPMVYSPQKVTSWYWLILFHHRELFTSSRVLVQVMLKYEKSNDSASHGRIGSVQSNDVHSSLDGKMDPMFWPSDHAGNH
jgi:hypothetical protein